MDTAGATGMDVAGCARMCSRLIIGVLLMAVSAVAAVSAQLAALTGAFRCESCTLTGQKPEPFDPAKAAIVRRVEPVFFPATSNRSSRPDTTLRVEFVARVLGTSPLRLEMLDSRAQHIDRNRAVVVDDIGGGKDPGTCGIDVWRTFAVAGDLQSMLPTLGFNDFVTGAWMLQQDRENPDSPLDGRKVISELRKATPGATWFHPVPATPNCRNRSGRLIVYIDSAGGLLTVYNDGAIQYSSAHGQVFAQRGLSVDELKTLLAAFGEASIDTAPTVPDAARISGSRLLLAAARYQLVHTASPPPPLAPVIEYLTRLRERAMSSARLILRVTGSRAIQPSEAAGVPEIATPLRTSQARKIDETPELATLRGRRYLWPRDASVRLADVPADGLIVPSTEVERHRLVYYGLLNAGFEGLTIIDGDRTYDGVRVCQIAEDGTDRCASK